MAEGGEGAAGRWKVQGRSLSSTEAFPGCECSVSEPSLCTWGHDLCTALDIRRKVDLGVRASQELSCEAGQGRDTGACKERRLKSGTVRGSGVGGPFQGGSLLHPSL